MYSRIREIQVGKEGEKVITSVAKETSEIDFVIKNFMSDPDFDTIIGLDAEYAWSPSHEQNRIAVLELCNGTECLIVQLSLLTHIPRSLLNFLRLPNFAFVGIGIKETVTRLEKDYGLSCKNFVELGPLAANVLKNPRLIGCGVDKLAMEFGFLCSGRPISVFDDWGSELLNKKHIKNATVTTHSYYMIGIKLLGNQHFGSSIARIF